MNIFKYEINKHGITEINTHVGKIVSIGIDHNNELCIWMMVDIRKPPILTIVEVFYTGEPIDVELNNFIGTVKDKELMLHIFQIQ